MKAFKEKCQATFLAISVYQYYYECIQKAVDIHCTSCEKLQSRFGHSILHSVQ